MLRNSTLCCVGLVWALAAWGCGDQRSTVAPTAPTAAAPPTSQLVGYVNDTSFRPVNGATVEVLDGAQATASAITDGDGRFSVNAATTPGTRFRATKDGYQPSVLSLQSISGPPLSGQLLTFFLATDRPSGNSATLTVDADPACTDLPEAVRTRTYTAAVTGNAFGRPNTSFYVNLTGDSLDSYFHFVFLRVNDGVVNFDLSDNGIEEEVAEEAYLFVGGVGSTLPPQGATTISAALTTGLIDYCVVKSDPGAAYPCTDQAIARVQCRSPKNRLTLTWR